MAWLFVPDGLVFHNLDLLGFSCTAISMGFTENGPKKSKYPVNGSSVGEIQMLC